ncbi:MAG TPA: radical SAM protein [Chloroflexi bacterium]|nr:radical SAM protein [Chloroflexota bacterium]
MAIAYPTFSSLDESQGIETRADPLAQAMFDIGWGRGYTLDMNVREIQAKTLLAHVKQPDTWFGLKYNMNLYRGCVHRCIYCDSRSECYQIEDFDGEVLVKVNAPELLRDELSRKRVKGVIGLGSMNDPFMPLPSPYDLTPGILKIIAEFRFPVHIVTKSDRVLRVVDTLAKINEVYASVSFTVTTADDALAARVEPFAPRPAARFAAMRTLANRGIQTGVTLMPVLPFIEDNEENVIQIVEQAHAHGASYVIPCFGMTLRDRQRVYYYRRLDELFPGLRARYERRFGENWGLNPG